MCGLVTYGPSGRASLLSQAPGRVLALALPNACSAKHTRVTEHAGSLPPVSVPLQRWEGRSVPAANGTHEKRQGVTEYQSPAVRAQVEAERRRLDAHRPSLDNGLCVVCRKAAPCPDANEAAEFLAERGLLVPPPEPEHKALLTHAWKRRFGLLDRRR